MLCHSSTRKYAFKWQSVVTSAGADCLYFPPCCDDIAASFASQAVYEAIYTAVHPERQLSLSTSAHLLPQASILLKSADEIQLNSSSDGSPAFGGQSFSSDSVSVEIPRDPFLLETGPRWAVCMFPFWVATFQLVLLMRVINSLGDDKSTKIKYKLQMIGCAAAILALLC